MNVVNKRTHKPTVHDVYIGRPSPLGNPFTHLRGKTLAEYLVSSRDEAIIQYRQWLYRKIEERDSDVIAALRKLDENSNLVCWCSPQKCHGDIIIEAWNYCKSRGLL